MAKKQTPESEETPFDFEKALGELEQLVERMEHGELTLEQSLKDFERGIELTRQCQGALEQAEQRVQILMQRSDGETLASFEPESDQP